MRLIDMQISVNGTAPAGYQTAQAQAMHMYRWLHEVDQARKTNLHRQTSTTPAAGTAASVALSDQAPLRLRSYVNRAKREEREPFDESSGAERYRSLARRNTSTTPLYIDFQA